MAKYSKSSIEKLKTCDYRLQLIFFEAIDVYDIIIIEGARPEEAQNKAFENGRSRLAFPLSGHNIFKGVRDKSEAIDASPSPIPDRWGAFLDPSSYESLAQLQSDAKSFARFFYLAGLIKGIAHSLNIKIRWGGDFNRDNNFHNDRFLDLLHWELDTK